jgi:UDPglucose 6-dehydrogenase
LLFCASLPQVTREQMMMEFDYTLGLNENTLPGMDKMIITTASAMEAVKVWYGDVMCALCHCLASPSFPFPPPHSPLSGLLQDAHAIAVMTEWDEFAALDFQAVYDAMCKPAFVFDGRNVLPHDKLRAIGFEVYAIGKPVPKKF